MQIVVSLDEQSTTPLYRQIADRIEELIVGGHLAAGSRLPSSRQLSESLSVSRVTVNLAYAWLIEAGLIETLPARGTYVKEPQASMETPVLTTEQDPTLLSCYGKRIVSSEIEDSNLELFPELNYSAAALDHLPLSTWRETLIATTRKRSLSSRNYLTDEFGHLGLRAAIRGYLARSRGISAAVEQIAIFSGAQPALDLITRLLIDQGDRVIVENPGFPGARRTFKSHGATLIPIAVDDEGIDPSLFPGNQQIKVAYVTPSRHDPTGVVLSKRRRTALLEWSKGARSFIIEDDFDSEFNYARWRPLALKAQDSEDSVLYVFGFWKVLFPIARVGFAVIPKALLPAVRRAKSLVERDFHFIEHEALAHFIENGHLEKHIRRLNTVYARKRLKLLGSLHKHCRAFLRISAVTTGTHLVVSFPISLTQQDVTQAAQLTGLDLVPLAPYHCLPSAELQFLIPFSHLDEGTLDSTVLRFAHKISKML